MLQKCIRKSPHLSIGLSRSEKALRPYNKSKKGLWGFRFCSDRQRETSQRLCRSYYMEVIFFQIGLRILLRLSRFYVFTDSHIFVFCEFAAIKRKRVASLMCRVRGSSNPAGVLSIIAGFNGSI